MERLGQEFNYLKAMLALNELSRYKRHILLPEIGIEGQEKLKKAKVLVIGAGGLGCPALQYLTAAGVGTIGIVDNDIIDESNLQRQILYTTEDVGKSKVETAKQRLSQLNPYTEFKAYNIRLISENALGIIENFDLVIDGSDNFSTRYLVNDACVIMKKPLVFGSIYKFEGQVSVFNFKNGPTYRCLFPDPPTDSQSCSEIGVIGVLPGIIGSLQANEAIKIITEIGQVLSGKLLVFDALTMNTLHLDFVAVPSNQNLQELSNYNFENCIAADDAAFIKEISVQELKSLIDEKVKIQIIDVRESYEYDLCNINGLLIPITEIKDSTQKISSKNNVIIHCHKGSRSKAAIQILQKEFGFTNLYNLTGGIDKWAAEIDTKMPKY